MNKTIREILERLYRDGKVEGAGEKHPPGNNDLHSVEEAEAQINQEINKAVVEELQKMIDLIDNYKPDPAAPSFGSASGAMESAGWKKYAQNRIAELQEESK